MDSQALATQKLIGRLAKMRPEYGPSDLLRLGLLLTLQYPQVGEADSEDDLEQQCQQVAMQLSASGDQHAAVSEELDSLAATSPCDFSPAHLWTLVRAIKVQNQILDLYLGPPEPASEPAPCSRQRGQS